MAITNITVRTEMCNKDSCVRYVIVYTNGRTIQGYRVYCLVSKVNIFSQGKDQGVKPTYPTQVSTAELYHLVCRIFGHQFSFMWGIVGKNGYTIPFLAILRSSLLKTVLSFLKDYYGFVFSSVSTLISYICLLKMDIGWMRNCHPKWAIWDKKWNGKCCVPHWNFVGKIMGL